MEKAIEAIGEEKSLTRFMHLGQGCHVLTFPVSMGTLLNVVAFVTDTGDWPGNDETTLPATKQEVLRYFTSFGPVVISIMSLLDDNLDKWGIFDLFESPVTNYISPGGRVCLAGDAAHASAPHHGAGAGFAIEDALALAVALGNFAEGLTENQDVVKTEEAICASFAAYEKVRHERTRWLIESSRYMGELFEWQTPECGSDTIKCHKEVEWRSHKIWDYDVDNMLTEIREMLAVKL